MMSRPRKTSLLTAFLCMVASLACVVACSTTAAPDAVQHHQKGTYTVTPPGGSAYLVNGVTIVENGQAAPIRAGELISDSTTQALVQSAGGVLVLATDLNAAAAATLVQKLRARGGNEIDCNFLMLSAYAYSANHPPDAGTDAGTDAADAASSG